MHKIDTIWKSPGNEVELGVAREKLRDPNGIPYPFSAHPCNKPVLDIYILIDIYILKAEVY